MRRRWHAHPRGVRAARLEALLLIVLLAGAVTSAAPAAAAAPLPLEGIFEGCPLDAAQQTCVQRLGVMHAGGFRVVVIPAWGASLGALQSYAAAAHALGMSVMWELSDPDWWQQPDTGTGAATEFGFFAAACGCQQNGPLLRYLTGWLGALPATYGYYAVDDWMLEPGDSPGVARYVAAIKQTDPAHMVMIGAGQQSETSTYAPIADTVGTMIYPVTTTSLMPASANLAEWASVAQSAAAAQRSADRAHRASAFILQAFTWGDNLDDGEAVGACTPGDGKWGCYGKLRYPSAAAQLQLRNEVLLHAHPTLILWWSFQGTYGQAGDDTYSIYPTGATAASRWSGLEAAVRAPAPSALQHRGRRHASRRRGIRRNSRRSR